VLALVALVAIVVAVVVNVHVAVAVAVVVVVGILVVVAFNLCSPSFCFLHLTSDFVMSLRDGMRKLPA